MKAFPFVFLLQLVTHRAAFGIPIYEAERSAPREDDALAQQDVKRNEGEKRYKRFCSVAPFDVQCHGHCPYDENEWNSSRIKWNCSNKRVGATYHCTDPDDESGNPIEACGVPTSCDKGKGPVISFPQGHSKIATINCTWCSEDYFNPSESIRSDNVSTCPKLRNNCGRHGLIECDIVTGVERHWTDSKCECDTKNNYFPLAGKGENKCATDPYLNCFLYPPCEKSPEGFDQIYIYSVSKGKYVCQQGCKEGFEFKTSQSKVCEPVQVDSNSTTFNNETTVYERSSLIPTTPEVINTTTSPPPTTTTEPHEEGDAGIPSEVTTGIASVAVLGFVIYIVIGVCNTIYITRASSKKGNSGRKKQVKFQGNSSSEENVQLSLQESLVPPPDVTDLDLHVSVWKYLLFWPCHLACFKDPPRIDPTTLPTNNEVRVKVGELLKLDIGISGSPSPTVTWSKDGNGIERATESNNDGVAQLKIQSAIRSDTGKYEIKVDNKIGSMTAGISVIVRDVDVLRVDLPTADENVPPVDGHNLTTGSDEPKESMRPTGGNTAIVNGMNVDAEMPTSEENQPQRRNMEQQEYSGGNSSSSSETESQDLRQSAADGRSSNKKVQGPQGEQCWIDELPYKLKQIKVSKFARLAEFIGKGWEALAKVIGLTKVNIDHIKEDLEKNSFAKRDAVIQFYIQTSNNPTLENFLHIMRRCSRSTTIGWKELEEYLYEEYNEYCQN